MNKYKINIIYILFLAVPICAHTQTITPSPYRPITQISLKAKFIATDKLQQIYAVTPKNEIIKYAPDCIKLYHYSNNTLGDLIYLDTTDPFNLLLYYTDYQIIITLDRTLNKTGELNLLNANALQVSTIGMSNDGNIWLYDQATFQLRKVDQDGKTLSESQNLNLLLPQAPKPTQLIARDNWVYLCDPDLGILVFNNFGQYDKTLDLKGVSAFQIIENRIFFREGNCLKVYDLKSFLISEIPLPEGIAAEDEVQIQQNRLFVKKIDRIEIYELK
ncbi:MAG: hypothetical protein SFU99_23065 [Saprospiraceae bacterium]|nr:hypothetical protein [Saprospiraceae bacterium]